MDDKEKLFEENMRLVPFVIKKYYPFLMDNEDAMQDGYLSLWKACLAFGKKEQTVTFSTYATTQIRNDIRANYRKSNAKRRKHDSEVSLDEEIDGEENECSLYSIIEDSNKQCIFGFDDIKDVLTARQIKILKYTIDGLTQREIGEKIGISRTMVYREVTEIRNKILNNVIYI